MIGEIIGPYKVLSHLGGGGMGVVCRAEDSRLGRTVALKFLPGEYEKNTQALERFDREARAVWSLNHPHICTVFDVGEWQSRRYIVKELLEGHGLDHAIGSRHDRSAGQ